jgi:hypothetical protein
MVSWTFSTVREKKVTLVRQALTALRARMVLMVQTVHYL